MSETINWNAASSQKFIYVSHNVESNDKEHENDGIPRLMGWESMHSLTRGDEGSVAIHQPLIHHPTGARHCRHDARDCTGAVRNTHGHICVMVGTREGVSPTPYTFLQTVCLWYIFINHIFPSAVRAMGSNVNSSGRGNNLLYTALYSLWNTAENYNL